MDCKYCGIYVKGGPDVCESCESFLIQIADLQQRLDAATREPLHYCIGGWTDHYCGAPAVMATQSTTDWSDVTCSGCLSKALKVAQGEVKLLTDLNALYAQQNSDNADEFVILRNQSRQQFEALTAANSRVERLREALKEIKVERCFDAKCACCKVDRDIAQKALADDAKEGIRNVES